MDCMEQSCSAFTAALASSAPVPGGGGAAALVGALGVALGNMVGSLTVGKKKYADVEADILALNARADALRLELLVLVDEDAKAFAPLSQAYGIPKDDPTRAATMERALDVAVVPPLTIMQKACEAIDLIAAYANKGSALAISDAGCAASLCSAALEAAALNVLINTKVMRDRDKAAKLNEQTYSMLHTYRTRARGIYENVRERLASI